MFYNDKCKLEDGARRRAAIKNLRFYPVKTLVRWWKNGDITSSELRLHVAEGYLPRELREHKGGNDNAKS